MFKRAFFSSDIFKNIVWLIAEKMYFVVLVFLSEAMISRSLGVTDYGKWVYSVNWVVIVSSVALVAGSEVLIPALSRHKRIISELVSAVFIIRMMGALLAFIFIWIYAAFYVNDEEIRRALYCLSFVLLLNEPFGVITNYYQSIIKIKRVVIGRCIALGIRVLFVLFAVHTLNNYYIYFSRSAEALCLVFFLIGLFKFSVLKASLQLNILKIVFLRGIKLWLPLVTMMIYLRVDRFFIEYYLTYDYLAIYGVSVQFLEQAFLLLSIIVQSVAPRYLFATVDRDTLQNNVKKCIWTVVAISAAIQISCILLLGKLILLVFGIKFQMSSQMVLMLLPAITFYGIDLILMQIMYRLRENGFILFKWTFMMVLSCTSYYIWLGLLGKKSIYVIYNLNYLIMVILTSIYYVILMRRAK
ncbi:oligosaccharide flippase family protein [Citrobacter portucalensis]|uniref:oligosaccharide flippase family protein n=2 Tax=Citrobacter portucalensis TaxID=1639133 RepID=UPI00397CE6E0